MLNPVHLRTFISLAETHHFTETAKRLNMTQPGVSQHIKKLEEQLGTALLNRFGKSFELTQAGERLYRYGLEQVKTEARFVRSLASDNIHQGVCQIACSGSMAMRLYPELLKLQKQYAGLTIAVEAAPNPAIIQRVKNNQSDLGLTTQPVSDPDIESTRLGEDDLCLIVPRNQQIKPSWQDLMTIGFIDHPDGEHYASQLLAINFPDEFRGIEKVPKTGYINQLSQILLPVSEGLGFTVLPRSSVEAFPHTDRIEIVNLQRSVQEPVYLITKKYRPLAARYQLVKELLYSQWQ